LEGGTRTEFDSDAVQQPALALVARAQQNGLTLRLIGGIAVAVHCPSAKHRALKRDYADIDYVTGNGNGRQLDELFDGIGYYPEKRFNSLHGRTRRLYFDEAHERQIDVFINEFAMCHTLPLAERLGVDSPTIPLAELFLSKAQIVEMNHKDMLDMFALLADHEVSSGDQDTINADRIADLCGKDWGLWRTVTGTLDKLDAGLAGTELEEPARSSLSEKIATTRVAADRGPRTMKWKARARIGERKQWYELPEDPRRGPAT
jgi:hypothetical protein